MTDTSYDQLKQTLVAINEDIAVHFSNLRTFSDSATPMTAEWERICAEVKTQLAEEVVRVAVVGAIKSGKSTFVNALLSGDHLKRGAGVVTAIVTRIRAGQQIKARLFFKSWDDVNHDIQQAAMMLPRLSDEVGHAPIDIRRAKDRELLQRALAQLGFEHLFTRDARNENVVLLTSYLKGYGRIKEMLAPEAAVREFAGDAFEQYKPFVSDESLAVYLKDVLLKIDSPLIDGSTEIADCQGSDSSNPLHLAMIQDYLVRTHLLIYVVSSRTGLRQADIKFLSIIKKMGILDNVMFIFNVDFAEHDSLNDFKSLLERFQEELRLIKPDPEVYPFSALFNLFDRQSAQLDGKDLDRYNHWQQQTELALLSKDQTQSFIAAFQDRLTRQRHTLLLKNNLERLDVVLSGATDWMRIKRQFLESDATSAQAMLQQIQQQQQRLRQMQTVIQSALNGAVEKIKKDLRAAVDRFFDPRHGDLLKDTLSFIHNYSVPFAHYQEHLGQAGFTQALALLFQEFKQALDVFVAESVNPVIVRFVREEELQLRQYLESVAEPHEAVIADVLKQYCAGMGELGFNISPSQMSKVRLENGKTIADLAGLTIPTLAANLSYSVRIKTEASVRLGIYTLVRWVRRLSRRTILKDGEEQVLALKDGLQRIKHETRQSVVAHFKDYRENIKFQYLFKLADAYARTLHQMLLERFQAYMGDLSEFAGMVGGQQKDHDGTSTHLLELEQNAEQIIKKLNALRSDLERLQA